MYKYFVLITAVFATAFVVGCTKDSENARLINCDNLITDTLGTNDTARLYIANAFTPNGDGVNDLSRVIGIGITSLVYTIYDENNNMIFTTTQSGFGAGWNPAVSVNTYKKYFYNVQATTNSGHHIGECGDLHVLNCKPADLDITQLHFEDQLTNNGFTGVTAEIIHVCP